MRISHLVSERTKDVPQGANVKSHILLVRAG